MGTPAKGDQKGQDGKDDKRKETENERENTKRNSSDTETIIMPSLRTSPQGIHLLVSGPIGPMFYGRTEAGHEKTRRKSIKQEELRGIELKKTAALYMCICGGSTTAQEKRERQRRRARDFINTRQMLIMMV